MCDTNGDLLAGCHRKRARRHSLYETTPASHVYGGLQRRASWPRLPDLELYAMVGRGRTAVDASTSHLERRRCSQILNAADMQLVRRSDAVKRQRRRANHTRGSLLPPTPQSTKWHKPSVGYVFSRAALFFAATCVLLEPSCMAADSGGSLRRHNERQRQQNSEDHAQYVPVDWANVPKSAIAHLEQAFLQQMKLPKRPRPAPRVPIPPHLVDLYNEMMEQADAAARRAGMYPGGNSALPSSDALLSGRRHPRVDFDTVRSVFPRADDSNLRTLDFDLDGLLPLEHLEMAELMLTMVERPSNPDTDGQFSACDRLLVKVFEAVRNHTVLLDSTTVRCGSSYRMDVTPAVARWRAVAANNNPAVPHGRLQLEVLAPRQCSAAAMRCKVELTRRPPTEHSPALLVYSSDRSQGTADARPRHRRSADQQPVESAPVTRRDQRPQRQQRRHRHRHQRRRHAGHRHRGGGVFGRAHLCRRQFMYVDFDAVGWKDWIVAPPGYDAHVCVGQCTFPLPGAVNTTNHAIVQSLIHSVSPGTVPPAKCVATSLAPLSLLFIDQYDKIVLKTYEDMVVRTCGCR